MVAALDAQLFANALAIVMEMVPLWVLVLADAEVVIKSSDCGKPDCAITVDADP